MDNLMNHIITATLFALVTTSMTYAGSDEHSHHKHSAGNSDHGHAHDKHEHKHHSEKHDHGHDHGKHKHKHASEKRDHGHDHGKHKHKHAADKHDHGHAESKPHHEHTESAQLEEKKIIKAARTTLKQLIDQKHTVEGTTLDTQWQNHLGSGAVTEKGNGYYIVSFTREKQQSIYLLLSNSGELYDANFNGTFIGLKK